MPTIDIVAIPCTARQSNNGKPLSFRLLEMSPRTSTAFPGKLVGTFPLVFFGCGSVAAAVAMSA